MATTTHPAELNSGIWTSWLPVTTAWTSQSACNSAAWARYGIQPSESFWPYIYDPAYAQSVDNALTCLPPEATQWWDGSTTVSNSITRWSLGPIVCPSAYSTVNTSVISGTSTSVICCPTSFNFARNLPANGGIDGVCTSTMTSGQSLTFASPASNSFTVAATTFTDSALLIAVPVEGYNFAASTTSSTTSSSTTSSSTSTTLQSNTTGTGQSTSTSAPTSGLSAGAKAGIGVGVAAIALIAVATALLFFRRRRKYMMTPTELPGMKENKDRAFVEANPEPQEIDGSSRPAELHA